MDDRIVRCGIIIAHANQLPLPRSQSTFGHESVSSSSIQADNFVARQGDYAVIESVYLRDVVSNELLPSVPVKHRQSRYKRCQRRPIDTVTAVTFV